jgi:hypothetical protein
MEYYADEDGIFQSCNSARLPARALAARERPTFEGSLTISPVPDNIRDSE